MAKTVKNGKQVFWLDPQGNEIPYSYVKEEDRKRDKMVNKVMTRVRRINEKVTKEKQEIKDLLDEYLNYIAAKYGEQWKGNATIKDFSDTIKIEVSVSERIEFGEKLQVAKAKIDECIKEWSTGSSQKIKLLVDRAFKTDKKGKLNNRMLLGLRQLKIEDDLWKEAMDILSESIMVIDSTEYYRFFEKNGNGKFKPMEVNFSAIEPEEEPES